MSVQKFLTEARVFILDPADSSDLCCLFAMPWPGLVFVVLARFACIHCTQMGALWSGWAGGGTPGRSGRCRELTPCRQERVKPTRNQFSTIKESIYLASLANCLPLNELLSATRDARRGVRAFQAGAVGAAPFKWGTIMYICNVCTFI